jgi:hypothetical protein
MLRIHEALLSTVALSVILTGMAAIDSDMRQHLVNIVRGDSVNELAIVAAPVTGLGHLALETLGDYQADNPLVLAFAVAAVVLFALLFRS